MVPRKTFFKISFLIVTLFVGQLLIPSSESMKIEKNRKAIGLMGGFYKSYGLDQKFSGVVIYVHYYVDYIIYKESAGYLKVTVYGYKLKESVSYYEWVFVVLKVTSIPDKWDTADILIKADLDYYDSIVSLIDYAPHGYDSSAGSIHDSLGGTTGGGSSSRGAVTIYFSVDSAPLTDQTDKSKYLIYFWSNVNEDSSKGENTYSIYIGFVVKIDRRETGNYYDFRIWAKANYEKDWPPDFVYEPWVSADVSIPL